MNRPVSGWPDVDHARTPHGWQLPSGIMPARTGVPWPRGVVGRASSEAESILATAVGWWDAAWYDGSRFLRNRGVAGELLDLRLGSSLVANSNDPLFLAPEETGYCYLPGVSSNYLSIADNRSGTASTWQVSALVNNGQQAASVLYSRASGAAALMGAVMQSSGSNVRPRLQWMDGTNTQRTTAAAATNPLPGGMTWVRFTLDASGANTVATFESAPASGVEPTSWTTVVTESFTGVTGITIPSVNARVGDLAYTTGNPFAGSIYRVIERIDGTTVLDVDCDALTTGAATSFTATTGQTVSIVRSASGRKTVAMPAKGKGGRACFLLGTDDYLECQGNWQHGLLNFPQGDSFTVLAVVRQWATPASNAIIVAKTNVDNGGIGWNYQNNATVTSRRVYVNDGTTGFGSFATTPTYSYGVVNAEGFVVNRLTNSMYAFVNGSAGTSTSIATIKSMAGSRFPMRIGRRSGAAGDYADAEFIAAAVFRRALTPREIKVLSDYYTAGG